MVRKDPIFEARTNVKVSDPPPQSLRFPSSSHPSHVHIRNDADQLLTMSSFIPTD